MIITSTLANFFSNFQNHIILLRPSMICVINKQIPPIASTLQNLGFINGYQILEKNKIKIFFKILENEAVIKKIRMVSKPGRRKYISYNALSRLQKSETFIISTNRGIMGDSEAKRHQLGGEIICSIF